MVKSPKMYGSYYVVLPDNFVGFSIAKAKVIGVCENPSAVGNFIYLLQTPFGECWRIALNMWESPEAIALEIRKFVIE